MGFKIAEEEPLHFGKIVLDVQDFFFQKKGLTKCYIHASLSSISAYLWGFFEVVGVITIKENKQSFSISYFNIIDI